MKHIGKQFLGIHDQIQHHGIRSEHTIGKPLQTETDSYLARYLHNVGRVCSLCGGTLVALPMAARDNMGARMVRWKGMDGGVLPPSSGRNLPLLSLSLFSVIPPLLLLGHL